MVIMGAQLVDNDKNGQSLSHPSLQNGCQDSFRTSFISDLESVVPGSLALRARNDQIPQFPSAGTKSGLRSLLCMAIQESLFLLQANPLSGEWLGHTFVFF